jgi:D-amino-acid oxidase
MKVQVIGAGISGLTTAVTLSLRGHSVVLSARDMPAASASMIAGAIWHPFFQEPDEDYLRRVSETYSTLAKFATDSDSGIMRRTLTEFFSTDLETLWWSPALPYVRRIAGTELQAPYRCAYEVPVFVADTPKYLAYLSNLFLELGGRIEREYIQALPDARMSGSDAVVNCSGYGAFTLCDDRTMDLVRGVVIEVDKPVGFSGCFIDDSVPHRPTYVIERETDCILGGTAESSLTGTFADSFVVDDIVARCSRLAPGIAGARIKGWSVGFRPWRNRVRLEADVTIPYLFHNYGHGGSGFTLSWGCASELSTLLDLMD